MSELVAAWLVLSAVFAVALHRHFKRLEAQREFERRYGETIRRYASFQRQISAALIPAFKTFTAAATDMQKSMQKVADAMNAPTPEAIKHTEEQA